MTHFWAKTTQDGKPGISVFEHMVNVGCVARCLADVFPDLLGRFQLNTPVVGALAALHDLGKISPGFQRKCAIWLTENGLLEIARNCVWDTAMEPDHGKVSHSAIQQYFADHEINRRTGKFLSAALGGHHGRLSPPNDRIFSSGKLIKEERSGIDWAKERAHAAEAIRATFEADLKSLSMDDSSPALWWLAGLTSVADWIGSDTNYFLAEGGITETEAAAAARWAVEDIGCIPPEIVSGLSFHDLFHDAQHPEVQVIPYEMQVKAISAITGSGVYVIEAPMGMGKTEAALGAAYQLLLAKKARGIYFALPTQATSNRIHIRMSEFVRRIAPRTGGSRLIHGNSWLMDTATTELSPSASGKVDVSDDARIGRDWFASAKRALLAPFGVGTVDQALLGVVAAKHFFVRHYALAGKVVILDEVHSYDLYTGTLIDHLIGTLEGLGCTIIVLSATLSGKRRGQIVSSRETEADPAEQPYPLITGRQDEMALDPVSAMPPKSRDLEIIFEPEKEATSKALDVAGDGFCVLWVCNTVDAAQKQFLRFQAQADGRFPIGLLHSRFPFWRREELEDEWMKRLGKSSDTRCGSILVSTQIVEQSVDLDADLLITELAPTDMLLQRTGRMWRHERDLRPSASPCLIILEESASLDEFKQMKEKAIVKAFGGKAYVYDPYVLLRSLEVWKARSRVMIPSQIRSLIEETYEDQDDEPESWQELFDHRFATDSGKKFLASRNCNLWQAALEDEEGVQTRLNEIPTLSLVLCNSFSARKAEFIDGTFGLLGGEDFCLATAQAIHRNLVKIPTQYFSATGTFPTIARYLHGAQSVGVVGEDGIVQVNGLKDEIRLRWSDELGLAVEKTSDKEEP